MDNSRHFEGEYTTSSQAIAKAIEVLKKEQESQEIENSIKVLQDILEQEGCEEGDGKLTSYIDIVICG